MRFEWCDSGWRCCLITWWQENAYGIGMRTLMTKAYPILPPGGLICNLCNRHYNVVLYLVKVWPRVHFISALNSRVRRVFGIVFFSAQPSLYHIFCLFSWVQPSSSYQQFSLTPASLPSLFSWPRRRVFSASYSSLMTHSFGRQSLSLSPLFFSTRPSPPFLLENSNVFFLQMSFAGSSQVPAWQGKIKAEKLKTKRKFTSKHSPVVLWSFKLGISNSLSMVLACSKFYLDGTAGKKYH